MQHIGNDSPNLKLNLWGHFHDLARRAIRDKVVCVTFDVEALDDKHIVELGKDDIAMLWGFCAVDNQEIAASDAGTFHGVPMCSDKERGFRVGNYKIVQIQHWLGKIFGG